MLAAGSTHQRDGTEMSGHEASFYIETYGCQMNSADSALVEQLLLRAGFGKAAEAGEADVVLLNTCTVRGHAESRIYGRFRQLLALRGKRPHLVLGMLGCLAQHHGGKLFAELPFLDVVAGPDSYRRLPAMLVAALQDRRQPGRLLDVRLDRGETYADLPAGTELA
ncbi:MAG: tRNA (N6-isopentenyl adenosine(37)-C2)-methylthiotransferase MiaB, partial [Deltaproteobacteria bacterium]|nr:tRNA (N6-isopentenyl adenosine(37)-C2)-methylthiotransferase MiaB [Deltaproteobacteria bacterium]